MGDDVAYGSEGPFLTENSLAWEAYLVLVRLEARRILLSEQFEVLNQLSQAIRMDCQGTNGHESVQFQIFEGRLDLKLARVAVVIVLHELNHLPIGHPLSVIFQDIGMSGAFEHIHELLRFLRGG